MDERLMKAQDRKLRVAVAAVVLAATASVFVIGFSIIH